MLDPNFAAIANPNSPGWTYNASDPNIEYSTVISPDNSTIAQFRSAAASSSTAMYQPLTLCPGTQYRLSAQSRQANVLADCSVEYLLVSIGDDGQEVQDSLLKVDPQTDWLSKDASFVAQRAEGALWVQALCKGWYGAPSGSDDDGWMKVEARGISVVREDLK